MKYYTKQLLYASSYSKGIRHIDLLNPQVVLTVVSEMQLLSHSVDEIIEVRSAMRMHCSHTTGNVANLARKLGHPSQWPTTTVLQIMLLLRESLDFCLLLLQSLSSQFHCFNPLCNYLLEGY